MFIQYILEYLLAIEKQICCVCYAYLQNVFTSKDSIVFDLQNVFLEYGCLCVYLKNEISDGDHTLY